MASIHLKNASVEIPVFSNHSRSLKNSFIKSFLKEKALIQSVTALHDINLNLKDGDRLGGGPSAADDFAN